MFECTERNRTVCYPDQNLLVLDACKSFVPIDKLAMLLTLASFSKIMQIFTYRLLLLTERWVPLNAEKAEETETVIVSDSYCHVFILFVLKPKVKELQMSRQHICFVQGKPGFDLLFSFDEDFNQRGCTLTSMMLFYSVCHRD